MHSRTLIRNEVVAILKAGATAAGDSVFPARTRNYRLAELPTLGVYTASTSDEKRDDSPRSYMDTTALIVEVNVKTSAAGTVDNVADDLDALCREVELLLSYDTERVLFSEAACVEDIMRTGTELSYEDSGEVVTGFAAISFDVIHNDFAPQPTGQVPLEQINATYNQDSITDPGDQVTDIIELDGATPP